jgi:hypothetical protein
VMIERGPVRAGIGGEQNVRADGWEHNRRIRDRCAVRLE